MTGVSFNISPYVHSYEAVKLQKGQEVPKDKQANLIQGDDGEQYMLTDAAKEQMIKDKKAFNDAYMMQSQMATSKANAEAEKKHAEDQAKAMTVYRNMANGDIAACNPIALLAHDRHQKSIWGCLSAEIGYRRTEMQEHEQ